MPFEYAEPVSRRRPGEKDQSSRYSVSNFRILIQVSENPHPAEGFLRPSEFDTL